MKKLILFQLVLLGFGSQNFGFSNDVKPVDSIRKIDLTGSNELNYNNFNCAQYGISKKVFDLAIAGYYKMLAKGVLKNRKYITICDMSKSSKTKRLYILDLHKHKVIYNTRVAHGQGSGEEYASKFSNTNDSHQTSLGFYTTGSTYTGENGESLQLFGRETGINDNAANRAIVMHGSTYVDDDYFKSNNRIGRSWGCPAIPTKYIKAVTNTIKNGSCLFIYHSSPEYLKKSKLIH